MSAPPPWREQPPGDLPAELALALGAAPGEPDQAELGLLAERLSASLGLGIAAPSAAAAAKVVAVGKPALGVVSSTLIGVLVGVGLSAAVAVSFRTDRQPAIARGAAAAPAAIPPLPRTVMAPHAAEPVAEPPVESSKLKPSRLPASAPSMSTEGSPLEAMEAELALLQRARAMLASDPSRTLALCADHARMFGAGALIQEREVIEIEALLRAGRTAEARAQALHFRESFRGSAHVRRVEALLEAASQ